MSKFFVGQPVRIVRPWSELSFRDRLNWMRLRGAEGRVTEIGCFNSCGDKGIAVAALNEDWVLPEDGLEPIVPEGQRAGDYTLSELLDRCKQGEGVPA